MHQPERINLVEIRTVWGYKTFELYKGDITLLERGVDILVVSAFERTYEPLPGTVLGALFDCGIDVGKLAKKPLFNLRKPFRCWVSKLLDNGPFKHIVCIETPFDVSPRYEQERATALIRQALGDLFAVLAMIEAKGVASKTLALPMLATGLQEYNSDTVIKAMLELSTSHLLRSEAMSTIKFVAHGDQRAAELRDAMDKILGRVQVKLPKGGQIDVLKREIAAHIKVLRQAVPNKALDDLEHLVLDVEVTPLGFGITGRDLAECIVDDLLLVEDRTGDLNAKIRKLQRPKYPVSEWAKEYLHILRTIGNEFAHGQAKSNIGSMTLRPEDMELHLMCIRRVLKYWIDYRQEQPQQTNPTLSSGALA